MSGERFNRNRQPIDADGFLTARADILNWMDNLNDDSSQLEPRWEGPCRVVDGLVILGGGVDLSGLALDRLPVRFGPMPNGDFLAIGCGLTSLAGSPSVCHNFVVDDNLLTRLTGGPTTVLNGYSAKNNRLSGLAGCVETLSTIDVSNNRLTDFVGGPKTVSGNYIADGNEIVRLSGRPDVVEGWFSLKGNRLTGLSGGPERCGGWNLIGNPLEAFDPETEIGTCGWAVDQDILRLSVLAEAGLIGFNFGQFDGCTGVRWDHIQLSRDEVQVALQRWNLRRESGGGSRGSPRPL